MNSVTTSISKVFFQKAQASLIGQRVVDLFRTLQFGQQLADEL